MHTVRFSVSAVEIAGFVLKNGSGVNKKHSVGGTVRSETCVILVDLCHNVNIVNSAVISLGNGRNTYDDHIAVGTDLLDKVHKSIGGLEHISHRKPLEPSII